MRAAWAAALLAGASTAAARAESLGPPATTSATVSATRTASAARAAGARAPLFYLRTVNPTQAGVPLVDLNRWVGPKATAPRPVLLSFAADYCGPCKRELQAYAEHHAALTAAGAQVVVVVIDEDPAARARLTAHLRDELRLPFPVVTDVLQLVAKGYGVTSLPHNVIVGTDGRIAWEHRGYREGESLPALLEALRGLGR